MRLLSLATKNFRTLEDIKLSFAKNYCTISGKNNAGKSSVIRLLSLLFRLRGSPPWLEEDLQFSYKEDRTQWAKPNESIDVSYDLELTKEDDPSLISFVEKMASLSAL
jgi:putative ATP-dependent endonuclease of the OLD family